jgi:hypothetical protein
LITVNDFREIELELVVVTGSVRALDLTELALEARVHDAIGLGGRDFAYVTVVFFVEEIEKNGETVTVFEAHPAAVTNFEGSGDFLTERLTIPISIFLRVVAQPVGGLIRNVFFFTHGILISERNERAEAGIIKLGPLGPLFGC